MMEPPAFLTLLCYIHMSLSLPLLAQISSGMTLPLIFPNSPESPLYNKNLTQRKWASRGELNNRLGSVLIKLGIGTFDTPISYKLHYLAMDTGSDLTWLQCEDCRIPPNHCFGDGPIVYTNRESSSYYPIPYPNHDWCFEGHSIGGYCSYTVNYDERSEVKGILSIEKFTFTNDNDIYTEAAFNLVFGCNLDHSSYSAGPDEIGILALGWGSRSFINQMKTQARDTFSYCFPHYDQTALGARGYLKLGSDGDSYDGFSYTLLHRYQREDQYYLNLEGISVNQQRLPIDPRIFVRDNDEGGTFIDSGASYSYLVSAAYKALKKVLQTYFKYHGNNNYKKIRPGEVELKFDLCYKRLRPDGLDFPSITLHFMGGADLVLNPDNVFIWPSAQPRTFCLAMNTHDDKRTILGAYQQSNYRFIYDRGLGLLLFKQEDCHQGV